MNKDNMYLLLILILVNLFLIYRTYMYLVNLENCECFDTPNNNVNLDLLKFYEIYLAVGNIILFISLYVFLKNRGGNKMGRHVNRAFIQVLLLILIVLYYYVTINIFRVYKLIKEDCACTQQWERFILYIQGFGSGVNLITNVVQLFSYLILFVSVIFIS